MRGFVFALVVLICGVGVVCADEVYIPELNTLNTIDYFEGQTIDILTRVLYGSAVQSDVSCGVLAVDEAGNIALQYNLMVYDDANEIYGYQWVPTPASESFWEEIYHKFFPLSGSYVAVINCTGGSLGVDLMDSIVIRVVPQ